MVLAVFSRQLGLQWFGALDFIPSASADSPPYAGNDRMVGEQIKERTGHERPEVP
jgi:hypothetical protein